MNDTVTYSFTVAGLSDAGAAQIVTALEQQAGVHRAQASVTLGRVAVDADPAVADPDLLELVINGTGHQARRDRR